MSQYVRNNAWNNGGTFDNSDLLWYAKGVGQMMTRALNDPTSWWFYAAIHGEYVNPANSWYPNPVAFPAWGDITSPPSVPTTPLPSAATQELYWNQCQHGSWYFLPWHRGYLMALETQLRHDIVGLGGPATWALPYWNYFGGEGGSQFQMPPAFAQEKLPDGSANPLYLTMRYGPDGDTNIYVPTAAGEAAHPNDPNLPPAANEVTEQPALSETQFSKADPLYGFGGPDTGFSHDGGHFGRLESNPHNKVHVYVGGAPSSTSPLYGLMADPGTAALDPIFYLHHCNIDRLWGVWNASGNANPTAPSWLDGPAQQFAMPDLNGQPWYYTPKQVMDLSTLDYGYQELLAQPAATPELATRLILLGAPAAAAKAASEPAAPATPRQPELLGANSGPLRIPAGGTQTVVKLDPSVRSKTVTSLARATETTLPDKAFLKLENVRGTFDATVLRVYVQVAGGGEAILADTVALFGLRRASAADGQHGGEGLTLVVDITHILDQLHLTGELNADALQVNIVPNRPLPDGAAVEVGRVSVYRQAF